jgi:phosphate-selective porin OprO/OprP
VSTAALPLSLTAQPVDTAARRGGDERGALRLGGGSDVTLTLGGYLQVDGRWMSGTASRAPDGLLLRRARLVFDAAMRDGWHVRLQPDFGQGRVLVQDAFVGRERGHSVVRVGRFRPAFGTERMQSSSTLLAPERGIVNSLMPSRSFGAQLMLSPGSWRVAVGGFRTPIGTDAVPLDTDGDVAAVSGSGHDLLLRVARQQSWRRGYVDWQASVLAGRERGTVDSPALARVLTVAQQPLLVFRSEGSSAGTIRAAGARTRASAGVLAGTPSSVLAIEGAWLQQEVARDQQRHQPIIGGAMVRLARVWRGERLRSQEIVPHAGRGAVEVGARAGVVGAWGNALATLLVPGSATHASTGGMAVSWLPSALTRLTLAVDITDRRAAVPHRTDGTRGPPPREHALLVRWQQGF